MKQFNKFFILGVFSTLIDFIIYTLFIVFGLHYFFAIVVGYGSGFVFNFFIGRKYIFLDGTKVKNFKHEFLRVLLINLFAVALNILIVYVLFSQFNLLDEFGARIVAIFFVFFWNFFARKIFVYH